MEQTGYVLEKDSEYSQRILEDEEEVNIAVTQKGGKMMQHQVKPYLLSEVMARLIYLIPDQYFVWLIKSHHYESPFMLLRIQNVYDVCVCIFYVCFMHIFYVCFCDYMHILI